MECPVDYETLDRYGIHEMKGPLLFGGADFLTSRTCLLNDVEVRGVLTSDCLFRAFMQFRQQSFRIAADQLVSTSSSPLDLFLLTDADGLSYRCNYLFEYIVFRSNGRGVDNISAICCLPDRYVSNFKDSDSDCEETLTRLKYLTGWSELQDHELRRLLESHMDLLKEYEISKMDYPSRSSDICEFESFALEKINKELGSALDSQLRNSEHLLMNQYYNCAKLWNLERECAMLAQTTDIILLKKALPVRVPLREQLGPNVLWKLPPLMKQAKEALTGSLGQINEQFLPPLREQGITNNEQFGRGGRVGKAWKLAAAFVSTAATVATVSPCGK